MSLSDYQRSKRISASDPSFEALLFALMRKADTFNLAKITGMWPDEWEELRQRYNLPGGILESDDVKED